jgi:hypothetical protein
MIADERCPGCSVGRVAMDGDFQDIAPDVGGYYPLALTNPWVIVTGLLLVVLILFLGFWWGRWNSREAADDRRRHKIDRLWKDIHEKARTAAAANRTKVTAAAQELLNEIDRHLGPLIVLSALGKPTRKLKLAMAGDPHACADDHGCSHDHGDGETGCGGGHGGHGPDAHASADADGHASEAHESRNGHGQAQSQSQAQSQAQAQSSASQINITISGGPSGAETPPPRETPKDCKRGRGGLDIDCIRKAVAEFNDYWDRPQMKEELRAAQDALC